MHSCEHQGYVRADGFGSHWQSFTAAINVSLGLQFRTDEAQIPAYLSVKVLQIHENLCCPLKLLLFFASTSEGQMARDPFGYQKVLKGAGGKSTQRSIKRALLWLKTCKMGGFNLLFYLLTSSPVLENCNKMGCVHQTRTKIVNGSFVANTLECRLRSAANYFWVESSLEAACCQREDDLAHLQEDVRR